MSLHPAYIAGLFDGEGTVGIYQYNGEAPGAILAVAGGHLPMINALKEHFGFGSAFTYVNPPHNDTAVRSPTTARYQLRRWEYCVTFLNEVRPYLMEKAEQADVFLEAAASRPGRGSRYTPDTLAQMEKYALRLKHLKKPHRYPESVPA